MASQPGPPTTRNPEREEGEKKTNSSESMIIDVADVLNAHRKQTESFDSFLLPFPP